jgi:hypothetical protein
MSGQPLLAAGGPIQLAANTRRRWAQQRPLRVLAARDVDLTADERPLEADRPVPRGFAVEYWSALGGFVEQRQLVGIWALDPIVPESNERRVDARCVYGNSAVALRDAGGQHLHRRVEEAQLHGDAVLSRHLPRMSLPALPKAAFVDHCHPSQHQRPR